jgi:hypothetical protein
VKSFHYINKIVALITVAIVHLTLAGMSAPTMVDVAAAWAIVAALEASDASDAAERIEREMKAKS